MFNIRHFISDTSFQIVYMKNYLNIINYTNIVTMDLDRIVLLDYNNKIIIKGDNLTVKKLLESEMVISGNIISIEFLNE